VELLLLHDCLLFVPFFSSPFPQQLLQVLLRIAAGSLAKLADSGSEVSDFLEDATDVSVGAVAQHGLLDAVQELGEVGTGRVLEGGPVFVYFEGLVQSAHEAVVGAE
jgi:hypothetical protein